MLPGFQQSESQSISDWFQRLLSRQRLSVLLWAMFLLPMLAVLVFGGMKLHTVKSEVMRKSDYPELFLVMQAALGELRYLDGIDQLRLLSLEPELKDEEIYNRYFINEWRSHFQKTGALLESIPPERLKTTGISKDELVNVISRVNQSIDASTLETYRLMLGMLVKNIEPSLPKKQNLLAYLYAKQFSVALAEVDLGNCLHHIQKKNQWESIEELAIFSEERWGHERFSTSIRDALFSYRHDSDNPAFSAISEFARKDDSGGVQMAIEQFSQHYNWIGEDGWAITSNSLRTPFSRVSDNLNSQVFAGLEADREGAKSAYFRWLCFLVILSGFSVFGALVVLRGLHTAIAQIQSMAVRLTEGKQWQPAKAKVYRGELGRLAQAVNGVGSLTSTIQSNLLHLADSISNGEARQPFKPAKSQGRWKQVADSINTVSDVHDALLNSIETENTKRFKIEQAIQKKQKNSLITRFAEGISHDFNNLLTVIIGHSEEAPGRTEMMDKRMAGINKAGIEARALVRKLMTAAGLSDVRLEPTNVSVSLKTALKQIPPDTWLYLNLDNQAVADNVRAEETILTQAIIELMKNAISAVKNNEDPRIDLTTGTVETGADSQNLFQLMIQDNGSGMDDSTLAQACEPFFTTRQNEGCRGLGLSTVDQLVEKADGDLQIESVLEKGTRVRLSLPISQQVVDLSNGADEYLSGLKGEGRCVFLIDDNDLVLKFTSVCLRKLGHEVITASDGEEGARVFREEKHRIGFIVSDILMPNLNGPGMIRKIKSEHTEIPPFIFITGFSDNQINQSGDELQRSIVLQKPFSLEKLDLSMKKAISESLESIG